ncbi:MAG TPA: PAS domain S-box protein, partial [Thermoplasmata archaeon]|nr:PAS domain S-box protein [Thermoplasmata archaeon]
MERKISSEEIEEDLAELVGALKTVKKDISVEKVLSNIIEDMRFQASELRKREQELTAAEKYFKNFFMALLNPIFLVDANGVNLNINPAAEQYFRRPRNETVGRRLEELYASGDLKKIREMLKRCKGKELSLFPFHKGFASVEVTSLRGDGTTFPAVLSFSPIKDEKGNVMDVLVTATDITELKNKEASLKSAISSFGEVLSSAEQGDLFAKVDLSKIGVEYRKIGEDINSMTSVVQKSTEELLKKEKELEESNAFLEDLIDSHPSMLGVLDEEGKWTRVNSRWEKICGWKSEEMLGKQTKKQPFILPERIKGFEERARLRVEKLSRGEIVRGEALFLAKDGTKRVGQFEEQWIKHKGKIIGRVVS